MNDENNSQGNVANDARPRRQSITANALSSLWRSNSNSGQQNNTTPQFPGTVNTANTGRRMSITATLGLSGTSPTQTTSFFPGRRASVSTAGSDSLNESAIDEEEGTSNSTPTTPFGRRMSFGAPSFYSPRGSNQNTSGRSSSNTPRPLDPIPDHPRDKVFVPAGSANARKLSLSAQNLQASKATKGRTPSDLSPSNRPAEGLNWSEQFRSRAESTIARPPFISASPPSSMPRSNSGTHQRAQSVTEMPPRAMPAGLPKETSAMRRKPDETGERMLRGQFYMD